MHVVFVDNLLLEQTPRGVRYDLQPHLGLLSLVAVAESGGHTAEIYNPRLQLFRGCISLGDPLYGQMAAQLLALRPDAIGFTTLGCNFICTLQVARLLRAERPDLPILLGGPHATILAREILTRFREFDAVARHEAELTLLPLLDGLRTGNLANVPGITYRDGDQIVENAGSPTIADLDALPRRPYDRHPIHETGLTTLRMEAGRGCPFHCTFCSTAEFFGRKYRLRSAASLVAEMDGLHAAYGIADFGLTHDLFTVNKQKVREFCDAVADRGYTWSCSARLDCVDAELLATMFRAGCRAIYYGIETGSPRMQAITEKQQDLADFDPIVDTTLRLGMRAVVSFITGYPQETAEDQKLTLDRIGECFRRDERLLSVQLHLLTPEPGTRLMRDFGDALLFDGHVSDFNFPTSGDDGAEMQRHAEVFVNHHYFPTVLPRDRHVFVTAVVALLHPLGFPVLTRMSDARGGRFGDLIDAAYHSACSAGWHRQPTREHLLALFASWWGRSHWLTWTARYVFTAESLGDGPPPPPARYRLSGRAALWTSAPDCSRILEILDRRATVDVATASATANYLAVLDDPAGRTLRNFELDDRLATFCSYLTTPRSRRDALAYARELGQPRAWGSAALDELTRIGAVDFTAV